MNIFKSFVDSDKEKSSALNESIFVEFKLGFGRLEGQNLVFRSFKSATDTCYYPIIPFQKFGI